MNNHFRLCVGLVVAMACAILHAATSDDDFAAGPVIAKGKGVEVRRGQLDDAFIAYRGNLAARGQSISEGRRESAEAQLLDRIIVTQLLTHEATPEDRSHALTNASKFLDQSHTNAESEEAFVRHLKSLGMTLAQFTNRVVEQAISEEVVTRELRRSIVISDSDVKKFYETNSENFRQPELARASHILIATRDLTSGLPLTSDQKQIRKQKAQQILERVRKGEDFTKVALEVSEDPAVKQNKGEYKFARAKDDPRRAMVPEFETAAFALKPGAISEIVTSDYGYHIIQLNEIIPAKLIDLAEVRERIKDHLTQVELEKRMTPYFEKLKKAAAIEVLDDRLKEALAKTTTPTRLSGP